MPDFIDIKTVWISSQSGPNDNHRKYIESVKGDIHHVDHFLRWQDINAPKFKRYLSWFVNGIFFPGKNKYQLFISIGEHIPIVITKKLGLLGKNQKIGCLHATETLYFIYSNHYKGLTKKLFEYIIPHYDVHICISEMQADLLRKVTNGKAKNIYTVFNGVNQKRLDKYITVSPDLKNKTILFIGNLYSGWRVWYKGIDLMLKSFEKALEIIPDLKLIVVGQVEDELMSSLKNEYPLSLLSKVTFAGKDKELSPYFEQSALYLHCARGEAFGVSVVEAMSAGLPCLVSEWTGAKEVVNKVSDRYIFPLEIDVIANKILEYFNLPLEKKVELSQKFREAVKDNTQEKAIIKLQETITQIGEDLKLYK